MPVLQCLKILVGVILKGIYECFRKTNLPFFPRGPSSLGAPKAIGGPHHHDLFFFRSAFL
jgi:hypothetical protein